MDSLIEQVAGHLQAFDGFGSDLGGSPSIIYEGVTEPEYGHVLIGSDSDNVIHSVYNIDGEFDYRNSADGATWSSVENVNPSGSSLPPGTDDFAPKTLITSDGIMHVAWIRGDKSSGYGDLRWRMRDLL